MHGRTRDTLFLVRPNYSSAFWGAKPFGPGLGQFGWNSGLRVNQGTCQQPLSPWRSGSTLDRRSRSGSTRDLGLLMKGEGQMKSSRCPRASGSCAAKPYSGVFLCPVLRGCSGRRVTLAIASPRSGHHFMKSARHPRSVFRSWQAARSCSARRADRVLTCTSRRHPPTEAD